MLELRNNLQGTVTMFTSKDYTENDKQIKKNKQLQANQESVVQNGENSKSAKDGENPIQITLKGTQTNTQQIKTNFENNENDLIKDLSTVQSSMSPGHFFEERKTEIAHECVNADVVPGDDKTKTEDENDRISGVLESSHQEILKSMLLEELEKATARLGFLERYKENVQQEIAKIKTIGLLRREQIRQEFDSFHDLLRQKEEKMLEQLDQEVNERVTHVINKLQASVVSLEKEEANFTSTVTELVQSSNDTRFIEKYARAKDLCQQMDVRLKGFHRDWAKNSMYTHSPVLDNYFTMRIEKRDLSNKLDDAMKLPKLRFKQNTLFAYPRSPVRLSEYMECSGIPLSTDVLYTMQLFHKRILVYELTSKHLQDMRLNDFSTFLLVPGMTFQLKVTSEYICHILQDQRIRRTTSCQMLIRVNMKPAKTPNFVQRRSENSETAINKNGRAATPDFKVFKLHITTKTTAKMRLESMKRRQIKLHNRRRKKKEKRHF